MAVGGFSHTAKKYVRKVLQETRTIDRRILMITYSGLDECWRSTMNDINTLPPHPNNPPASSGSDLDDLIFQGDWYGSAAHLSEFICKRPPPPWRATAVRNVLACCL